MIPLITTSAQKPLISVNARVEGRVEREVQMKAHLAKAGRSWRLPRGPLDPRIDEEFEVDLVKTVTSARTLVGYALETIRTLSWTLAICKR